MTEDDAEIYFGMGMSAAEIDESNDVYEPKCPYEPGTIPAKWWGRGYSYVFRLFRALRAEAELGGATK